MATTWAQTASEMIRSALEHMSVVGATETPSAEDSDTCLRALNGLLKELPIYGYLWPEYREGVALTWAAGAPSAVSLPADFYGFPFIRRSDGMPLQELSPAQWGQFDADTRAQTAEDPTHFYRSGSTLTLWPIPTADPGLTCNYQSKIDDATQAAQPDMPQSWHNALPWGIAYECRMKFACPIDVRQEIAAEWKERRAYLLDNAAPTGPIEFSVAD